MQRICLNCGKTFESRTDYDLTILCPSCAAESRKQRVMHACQCQRCGVSFMGYPRSKYCPKCSPIIKSQRDNEYHKRQRAGSSRHLGDIDKCIICGGEYIVKGGLQKYCPDCAPEAVKAIDRAQSKQWIEENRDNEQRRLERRMSKAPSVCPICKIAFDRTGRSHPCPQCRAKNNGASKSESAK